MTAIFIIITAVVALIIGAIAVPLIVEVVFNRIYGK
jgi:hypothetical protein